MGTRAELLGLAPALVRHHAMSSPNSLLEGPGLDG